MAWTYKTKYSITTVLTPPSTPSPTTPAGAASPAAPQPSLSAAMGLNAHIASLGEVTRAAQAWWQRDPRRQLRTTAVAHPATSQPHVAPWRHASLSEDHPRLTKRGRDTTDNDTNPLKKVKETSPSHQLPKTDGSTGYLDSNITDLLTRLISKGMIQVPESLTSNVKKEPIGEFKRDKTENKSAISKVDLDDRESLRVAQPGLVAQLYAGTQCSNCSTRFPPTQTARYSQHLDWHFRQNGRDRLAKCRAQSRPWHYATKDWLQYEEVEDLDKREKSWFEIKRANEAKKEVKEVPSVVAGALADDNCWVCGDKFVMFYNDDDDEWHLKDSMRHGDKNFHPVCLESYEKSPMKHERRYEVAEEETKERASIVITVPDDD